MNLKEKLVKVSDTIGYVQKDKKNSMQNYSYLSEAKIKEVIQEQFIKQGIVFNYSTSAIREYEISPTQKGTKQFNTIANGLYSFIDVDSDEKIDGTWFGSGTDTGDKGLYKAITGGIKYVLNTNFLIPTGDDPENDDAGNGKSSGKPEPKITPKVTPVTTQPSGNDFDWAKLDLNKIPKWNLSPNKKPLAPPIVKRLFAIQKQYGIDPVKFKNICKNYTGKEHSNKWTYGDIKGIEEALNKIHDLEIDEILDEPKYEDFKMEV